jgi:hypothetical protein
VELGPTGFSVQRARAFLDHAEPAVGSQINSSPAEVRIWFSERLEPALSRHSLSAPKRSLGDRTWNCRIFGRRDIGDYLTSHALISLIKIIVASAVAHARQFSPNSENALEGGAPSPPSKSIFIGINEDRFCILVYMPVGRGGSLAVRRSACYLTTDYAREPL